MITADTALRTARAAWSKLISASETDGAFGVEVVLQTTGFELAPVILAISGDAVKLGEVLRAFDTISSVWTHNEALSVLRTSHKALGADALRALVHYTGSKGPEKLVTVSKGRKVWTATGETWRLS